MIVPNFMKMHALALNKLGRTLLDMMKLRSGFLNVNHNKQAFHKLSFNIYRCLLSFFMLV